MTANVTSVAVLCLLFMERFLASDMDSIAEPILVSMRAVEKSSIKYQKAIFPFEMKFNSRMTKCFLFTQQNRVEGKEINTTDSRSLGYFRPELETKIIIHGFLDKIDLAQWMHQMKDEFLVHGDYNVIIVDWSSGNFLPYTKAAANTEKAGEEIAQLILHLKKHRRANVGMFHILGHSLGAHVAGYVGERVKGLKRITGLDPATHLFSDAGSATKLNPSDAEFVDVIHSDGGGIGMDEPVGHVDFYPNNGKVQPGCTASNSLRTLLERGVVEGARSVICSHMRAPYLFTDTINSRHPALAHQCENWGNFTTGRCTSCGKTGKRCASMGYHVDPKRGYRNGTKFYLMTAAAPPYYGHEYKISLRRDSSNQSSSSRPRSKWPNTDELHITLYGNLGNSEFKIRGQKSGLWQGQHVVFSPATLGNLSAAVIRWSHRTLAMASDVEQVMTTMFRATETRPFIKSLDVSPLETLALQRRFYMAPVITKLCLKKSEMNTRSQQGATFKNEYC